MPRPHLSLTRVCLALLLSLVFAVTNSNAQDVHSSQQAVNQFDLHPDLDVELFAAEPMMANPSNIDVDHRGRVWVCEVLNYRHFRNKDATPREAGDRILILEDTDGDAKADKSTVFYQGRDIDSAHGICVLGDRAIVSANDSVFYLIDTDGDSKADKKEILFTGISGTQHDHGIHAFVFGPDGKLYFNFGNEGRQIKDKQGNPITDLAGKVVNVRTKPYNQGMVFRCNLDGSEFETLAWNFRNNWEVCVDSFGSLWQSDNDDDGNKATRINFVMPFGNYGYTDQVNGNGWRVSRTNMHPDIPVRHWHQNDPGVVPNLLVTGAGSPTGICIYEGDTLPEAFRNQVIHCDAGPSIVRAYPVKKLGAGYSATIVNMMDGAKKNKWFRPSDVCVAPDGSLIIADWYDPGVGGHRMQDTNRGRLFRLTQKGKSGTYRNVSPDFSTPGGAVAALHSPNLATRFLAWKAIQSFGEKALKPLLAVWSTSKPRMQARALWAIGKLAIPKEKKLNVLHAALQHENSDLRVTAIRLCVQLLRDDLKLDEVASQMDENDPADEVRRELLIGLRQVDTEHLPQIWATLADQYDPADRWYLEALGIAADGNWDACLKAWIGSNPEKLLTPAGRDIAWRSRGEQTPEYLAEVILSQQTDVDQTPRYFRAFDLLTNLGSKSRVLATLALGQFDLDQEKAATVMLEAASRLDINSLSSDQKKRLDTVVENSRGTDQFVRFVEKFASEKHYPELLEIAKRGTDRQKSADAMRVLLEKKWLAPIHVAMVKASEADRAQLASALVNSGSREAIWLFKGIAERADLDQSIRGYAVKKMGEVNQGARELLNWLNRKDGKLDGLMASVSAALHQSRNPKVRAAAQKRFPIAQSKDAKPLPSMIELVKRQGNIENGANVFANAGTCSKCHIVDGKGIEVGPNLSEIGSKLSKLAMYESILFPSAGISHNYESWMVLTEDGQTLQGLLVSRTDAEIQLKDDKGIVHRLSMNDVDEIQKQKLSLMPADLHKDISQQELVDLVDYLMSLTKK